nr:MAG TPA: hypothetical protein [Caudoviricetes sp.]
MGEAPTYRIRSLIEWLFILSKKVVMENQQVKC